MKKRLIVLILLAVSACGSDKNSEEILDQQAMVSYLVDLHLTEAAITNLRLSPDSSKYIFAVYEQEILDRHNTTDSIFVRSYNYYLGRPEELQEIYTAVVDSLSLKQSLERYWPIHPL